MEKEIEYNIIKRVIDGDSGSFGSIIRKYQNPLFNMIFKMTNSKSASEDLLQIVFIKAYENLSSYNPDFKFFSWIYRIAVNETINYLKSKKKTVPLDEMMNIAENKTDELDIPVTEERVQFFVNKLKDEYKLLITLKYYQGLSYDEISLVTGFEINLVKSRLYIARNTLKEMILKNQRNG